MHALQKYSYRVHLNDFVSSNKYRPFFTAEIEGDRESTMAFEKRFQQNAIDSLEAYFEVLFWKLYSQGMIRDKTTIRTISYMEKQKTDPCLLWERISSFVHEPNLVNLKAIRLLLGYSSPVLAVCLTFPTFHSPDLFPMVDNQVARWVNSNCEKYNSGSIRARLAPFFMNYTSLRDNDFPNYLKWVDWCREVATLLTGKTGFHWRARDVEMAVFTSQRSNLWLNIL